MADILIQGILAPNGTFPIVRDSEAFAGFRRVADITARDAITTLRRAEGMWVYVISTNEVYRLGPGLTNADWVLVTLSGGGTNTFLFSCTASVAVQDAVYLSAADTVDRATATDPTKQPVVGFVTSKPSSITAMVQTDQFLTGFSGLMFGKTYFLSTTVGAITDVAPTSVGQVVQRVGYAKNSTTLWIEVDRDIVIL